jgi:hypothetical protein
MNEPEPQATEQILQPERPERWDEAVVAAYIYDLLKGSA